jgi:hypothetical protein
MPTQQIEVDQPVGIAFENHHPAIAALGDVAPRGALVATTRANPAMANEECGKRAEDPGESGERPVWFPPGTPLSGLALFRPRFPGPTGSPPSAGGFVGN